jgi:hypothetical protein
MEIFVSKKNVGSIAKNLNIEPNNYFHIKDYKKADYFSENMQI